MTFDLGTISIDGVNSAFEEQIASIDENFNRHDGSLVSWFLGSGSYGLEVLYDQPLAFWRLNETTGTAARGLMSNYVNGTYTAGYTLGVSGPLDDALTGITLNGSTGYVDLTTGIAYLKPTTAFSLEAWIKTATVSKPIFKGNARGLSMTLDGSGHVLGTFVDGSGTAHSITSAAVLTDNVYHQVVVTYNGEALNLYIDGVSTDAPVVIASAVSYTGFTALSIGATGGATSFFNGQLADVSLYDTPLSAARVLVHYQVGMAVVHSTTPITPALVHRHYDLRTINNANTTVPYSQNDLGYWNASYFTGTTALAMATGTTITRMNENWDTGTVSLNSSWRYQGELSQAVTVATSPLTIASTVLYDDISTDLSEVSTYYIEAQLRGFPAQAATNHFNLATSFIDISSDSGYDVSKTDSIALSASLVDLTGGGDITFRINKNLLVNSVTTALQHVRFRLTSIGAGTATFQLQSIRVYPSTKVFNTIDVETRRGVLVRTLPQNGIEWTKDFPPMYNRTVSLKNFVYWMKFNTGHAPVKTTGSNRISFLIRYNEYSGQFIQMMLEHNASESRIRIFENFTEIYSTAINTNTLTASTDYYFKIEANGGTVRGTIYNAFGVFPTGTVSGSFPTQVFSPYRYTTDWQTVSSQDTGFTGLWFQPYYYDFTADFARSSLAQSKCVEQKTFLTQTPVRALTLNPKSSADIDILGAIPLSYVGDGIGSEVTTIGNPSPSQRVQRTGATWFGGVESVNFFNVGNPETMRITLDLFVDELINGSYRVYLKDGDGLIAYLNNLSNITPGRWNSFSLTVNGRFVPGPYKLGIHQTGFFSDIFYIDNVHVYQPTFFWEGSVDGGVSWYPFHSALGSKYSNLNFPNAGNQVKLRGSKVDTSGWVAGWELVTVKGYPGQTG